MNVHSLSEGDLRTKFKMGWFLLRKPYPGLTEEQRIDIHSNELHVGRGRECSVHCLSMYVSRKHLTIIPKEGGNVCLKDHGSSNGTFVNQTKITPGEEFPLKVGDEIGIGNINCDNKDCFVYEVRQEEDSTNGHIENVKGNSNSPGVRHSLDRGLKRFATEPEVVTLDDDDDDIFLDDCDSKKSKKPKIDHVQTSVPDSKMDSSSASLSTVSMVQNESKACTIEKKSPGIINSICTKEESLTMKEASVDEKRNIEKKSLDTINSICSMQESFTKKKVGADVKPNKSESSLGLNTSANAPQMTSADMKSHSFKIDEKSMEPVNFSKGSLLKDSATSDKIKLSSPSSGEQMCPPPLPAASSNTIPGRFSLDKSITMPKNPRLSCLMEDRSDMSAGTFRLSSPSLTERGSSSSACSTPNTSKQANHEDALPVQTSTPCVSKIEKQTSTCTSQSEADWSPIVKDSSRHSQDSSANYTLDEQMIPVDSSDDEDEEIFPCSQLFAEDDDVKPVIEDLREEADIVDLSMEDEPEENKISNNDELDEIVLSSDEDEDDIEDANRWYMRLSQSLVKKEPLEDNLNVPEQSNILETDAREDNEKDKDPRHEDQLQDIWNIESEEDAEMPQIKKKVTDFPGVCKIEESKEQKIAKSEIKVEHKPKEAKAEIKVEHKPKEKLKEKSKDEHKDRESVKAREKEREKERVREKDRRRERERKSGKEKKSSKEKDMKDLEHRKKKEQHRTKSTDTNTEKHRSHINSHSFKQELKNKNEFTQSAKLREMFPDSDSDESMDNYPESSHKDDSKSPPPSEEIALGNISNEHPQPLVTLTRIEDDPKTCERFGLVSSDSPSGSPLQKKKSTRQIELVPALPMPPRRAINRGISSTTALKMFEGDKQKPLDSKVSKSVQPKDKKALRKERLAEVAAQNASKDKGNSESKRTAPAKIKVTSSNRGSFLVDNDECSPASRPKSRRDIRSIKIPKLKNKPAIHLPTKSPLQDMNMSWDKSKPEECALPEPVEIPTGPQPKKRVAQVPPPGFYGDSSSKPIADLPPPPNKSCLSGSSKHNIALNEAKPIPVQKRVRFKENLVEYREIERLPNTRPVGSSMDADRPKPMSQVSLAAPPMPFKAPVMPSDEIVLQDVIYDISKWNPLWLKEEKNLPADVSPPVVSNMDLPTIPKTEFLDFKEYHDTMYPLLMLELWNGVSKQYNSNESRKNMIMAVDSATSSAVYHRPDRMLTTLHCHMIVDERGGTDHPRLGNLVVIDLCLKDPADKLVVIPVFGYVSFDSKDRLRQSDQVHKDLVTHCHKPAYKIRFSVMIRERKNCTFNKGVMRVKNVKYIRGDLRVFQAMKNLEYMPLQYSIISPSAANEDFTLPEINSNLAYPEQLNETQVKVVLKTAAVCQEVKPKICLIQGPPGTGKSHVIASLVMQLLYRDSIYSKANREKGLVPRVLVCAPSNNAVDLLVRRLLRKRSKLDKSLRFKMVRVGQPQYMQQDVKGVSLQELAKADVEKQDKTATHNVDIESLKAKLRSLEDVIENLRLKDKNIPQELTFRQADILRKLRVLEDRSKQQSHAAQNSSRQNFAVERAAMTKILRGADIVATTLNSCMIKVMENVFPPVYDQGKYHFQVCIVDEATQCLEVETLIPLLLGVKTLVLVGDPNQLPATILSKVAREKGLGTSLFARLQKIFPQAPQLLDTQYRMHPEILRWPNKFFYNRRLKTPESLSFCRDSKVIPYAVLSLPFQQDRQGEVNVDEAKLVLQLAEVLINKKVIATEFKVGIITPYQSQRRTISSMLQERAYRDLIEVNTIDSYQGQEKDVTIISCVRTNGVGFLSDRQRINVALTRAKYAEFICGNFSSLDRDNMWNNLLTDARQRNCFHEVRGHCENEVLWNYVRRKP
ncbi:hypothetical protein FOCC_FOCC013590 [Frankliniella occidentalis]|nr:hypothetical protein FOCC_FOCC013590 [Frankliniella occidentalis]